MTPIPFRLYCQLVRTHARHALDAFELWPTSPAAALGRHERACRTLAAYQGGVL